MSRSTRSSNKPLPTASILLQGKLKPIPNFLAFHHFPKLGVRADTKDVDSCSASSASNTTAGKKRAMPSLDTSPQKASHLKSKKACALESTYPPTQLEIEAHESYLRRECIQLMYRAIEEVASIVLRRCSEGTMGGECRKFFDLFTPPPDDETDVPSEDVPKSEGVKRHLFSFRPMKYPPSLLPMVIVKCYPSLLDRSEIVKSLVQDLSTATRLDEDGESRRSCVCVIKSGAELIERGNLIAELLFQCTAQDPSGRQFNKHMERKQRRQKSNVHGGIANGILFKSIFSYTECLIEWAGCTMEFDELVVVLEDPENISSPDLDIFFTTLASLRSVHGVPISLIVMSCTPGGLGDRLSKLRQPAFYGGSGDGGVMQRVLNMPLPEDQLVCPSLAEILLDELVSRDCIPSFLRNNETVFNHVQEVFHECDNSIVGAARRLKTELSCYFSLPGAYASMLYCKDLVLPNWDRVSWLMSQSNFKTESTTADGKASPCQLTTKITISLAFHHLYQTVNSIESSKSLNKSNIINLLRQLHHVRSIISGDYIASSEELQVSLLKQLNGYIILVGEALSKELDSDIRKSLLEDVKYWIVSTCQAQQIELPELLVSATAQPRKDIVKAFSSAIPTSLNNSLTHALRISFQCFDTRILTLSKWYEKYFDIVTNHPDISSNESLFFLAIQELVYCGFIRKLTSARRKDEAYEKIAVVWGQ
ncbi:hypothetical protein ACHAWO_011038 [Cyclotella atomus]|uniref:Origin recognition complex subunit 3 n=1 Tax=Cyclotella atomus TaxID=382360 RepID=A0ABD3N090_9STRA